MAISGSGEQINGNKSTVLRVALSNASLAAGTPTQMLIFPTGTTMPGFYPAQYAGWLAGLSGTLYSTGTLTGTFYFQAYIAPAANQNSPVAVASAVTPAMAPTASQLNYPAPYNGGKQVAFNAGDVLSIWVVASAALTGVYANAALSIST